MEELFRPDDEVYTDLATAIGRQFYEAVEKVLDQVLCEYNNPPLRQLEYIAAQEVELLFAFRRLNKMVRIAKEKRSQ